MFVLNIREIGKRQFFEEEKCSLREVVGEEFIIEKGILGFSVPGISSIFDVHSRIIGPDIDEIICYTWEDEYGKKIMWHSGAHILADAVLRLFPDALLATGPPVENGFYYDILFKNGPPGTEDIKKIEELVMRILKEGAFFERSEIPIEEAKKHYTTAYPNKYKLEILEELEKEGTRIVSFYRHGNFVDLCEGPHILTTSMIKAFKITGVAGAYWRGDATKEQLCRIYGIAFPDEQTFHLFEKAYREAEQKDHRKVGYDMEIFLISSRIGAGLPIWLPGGFIVRNSLIEFIRRAQNTLGYQEVFTPHIGSKNLYITSGHYEKYGQNSYKPILTPDENEEYLLKPMNCPHHCEIFGFRTRSYRELPLKISEFGTVYRYEKSGEIHGLVRARCFTQDDAHIFVDEEHLEEVLIETFNLATFVLNTLGFSDVSVRLSLRDPAKPEEYIGETSIWEKAEKILKRVCDKQFPGYTEGIGEAAFYGPKVDFIVRDLLHRKWQVSTVQLDFNLPRRFNLKYISRNNTMETPIIIHRALLGSIERFVALLLEHTGGNLPLWLAPIHVAILPVKEEVLDYSRFIEKTLAKEGYRVVLHWTPERLSKRIKQMEIKKVPFQVVVGEKEKEAGLLNIRSRREELVPSGATLPLEEFIARTRGQINIPEYRVPKS